jgi:hypothetical protein
MAHLRLVVDETGARFLALNLPFFYLSEQWPLRAVGQHCCHFRDFFVERFDLSERAVDFGKLVVGLRELPSSSHESLHERGRLHVLRNFVQHSAFDGLGIDASVVAVVPVVAIATSVPGLSVGRR